MSKKEQPVDMLSLSHSSQILKTEKQSLDLSNTLDAHQSVKLLMIRRMLKALTGYDFKLFLPGEPIANIESTNGEIATVAPVNQLHSVVFGLVYEHQSVHQDDDKERGKFTSKRRSN